MSTSSDVIPGSDLRLVSGARSVPRRRRLKPAILAAASLLSLAGFMLVAAVLRAPYSLAAGLLGFAAYVLLMAKALECLQFDWDVWTNPRKPALPPPPRGKIVPFGRGPAAAA